MPTKSPQNLLKWASIGPPRFVWTAAMIVALASTPAAFAICPPPEQTSGESSEETHGESATSPVAEVCLDAALIHPNPYRDVEVTATFTQGSESVTVKGFWGTRLGRFASLGPAPGSSRPPLCHRIPASLAPARSQGRAAGGDSSGAIPTTRPLSYQVTTINSTSTTGGRWTRLWSSSWPRTWSPISFSSRTAPDRSEALRKITATRATFWPDTPPTPT